MDFDITKVTIDGSVSDLSEEQLRKLVDEFQEAQESNVAEFERLAEEYDDVDETVIEDFEDARTALIGEITEAETFDEVPLSEDALEDAKFSELQEWRDFVSEDSEEAEDGSEADEEGEGTFDDFGKRSPKDNGDETEDFVEDALGDVQGLNL
jgi:thioesterase domain-containing protein